MPIDIDAKIEEYRGEMTVLEFRQHLVRKGLKKLDLQKRRKRGETEEEQAREALDSDIVNIETNYE